MNSINIVGQVNDQHVLTVRVPDSIPAGPVTVLITPQQSHLESEDEWMAGIAHEWADDLNDARQDIYTLADGVPVDAS